MSATAPSHGEVQARPHWRVRPMSVSDLALVAAIEAEVYPFPWTRGNFADSLAAGYDAWVFETAQGHELFGYAIVMWLPDEVHLLNLSVATRWQGQGLGASMLDWLMRDAAHRRAQSMLLEVRPSNERALLLYERLGFRRVGVRRRYYPAADSAREDAIVMVRRLVGEGTNGG
jgi:[ribosomal protein S18]-alanine N-acetyltransferase